MGKCTRVIARRNIQAATNREKQHRHLNKQPNEVKGAAVPTTETNVNNLDLKMLKSIMA